RGDLLPRLLGSREMDREDSVAGRAVEQDVSACLRDDVLHGREAEPGAAFTLRGEVGLEDTRVEIALYAGAGVLDDEAYESVAARDARLGWRALDRARRRRDTQAAPVRHGIAGVHRQVQHDLLDLVAVGEDGGVSVQLQLEIDPLVQEPQQERSHGANDLAHIDRLRARHAAVTEGEQV